MDDASPEHQYVAGQYRPTFPRLFDKFEELNAAARQSGSWRWDIAYGHDPRETLDVRRSSASSKGVLLYLHAGYWQSRDKRQFHFIAPALNEAGFDVAFVNYPLCPNVTVGQIASAVAKAPARVLAELNLPARTPMVLAGHSAGAHLAVEVAVAGVNPRGADAPFAGILAVSGIYDLEPLLETTLNEKLGLTQETAVRFSPVHRVIAGLPPASFVTGADETDEFRNQSMNMASAWSAQSNACRYHAVPGTDHFSILNEFRTADGILLRLSRELLGK